MKYQPFLAASVLVFLLSGIAFSIMQIPISYIMTTITPHEFEQLIPTRLNVPLVNERLLVNPHSHTTIQMVYEDRLKSQKTHL